MWTRTVEYDVFIATGNVATNIYHIQIDPLVIVEQTQMNNKIKYCGQVHTGDGREGFSMEERMFVCVHSSFIDCLVSRCSAILLNKQQ